MNSQPKETPLIIAICGKSATGKAQPNSTIIPTPKGPKKIGELNSGDYVFDRKGHPTKIIKVFPQGKQDVYKITFSDGRTSLCCKNHIWTTWTSRHNFKNRTVEEMLQKGLKTKYDFRYKIPLCSAIEYDKKEYKIHPYLIGAFLGDGNLSQKQLTFTSADEELVKNIAFLLNSPEYRKKDKYQWNFKLPLHFNKKENNYREDAQYYSTVQFFSQELLLELGQKSSEKKIPDIYLYGDIKQRYSLLQGLFDTDGSISEDGHVSFTSTSLILIKQVQELCWSLGILTGTIFKDIREKYNNNKNICYTIGLKTTKDKAFNIFSLSRKRKRVSNLKDRYSRDRINITKIEKLGYQEEMTCIYVDNKEHLYLTNDYIVTHNTTLASFLTKFFTSKNIPVNNMVSMTTRPLRVGEVDGVDYYFVDNYKFDIALDDNELIEHTHFRTWRYGIPFSEVQEGCINIGVFNLEGLKSLRRSKYNYAIIPVYLEESLRTRLKRSHDREGKWKIEYMRRAFVDWQSFRHVEDHLNKFHGRYIRLRQVDGVWEQSNRIMSTLLRWRILERDKETKELRLGNFV